MSDNKQFNSRQSLGFVVVASTVTFGVGVAVGCFAIRIAQNRRHLKTEQYYDAEKRNNACRETNNVGAGRNQGKNQITEGIFPTNQVGASGGATIDAKNNNTKNGEYTKSIILVVQRFRYGRFLIHHNTKKENETSMYPYQTSSHEEKGKEPSVVERVLPIGCENCDIDPNTFHLVRHSESDTNTSVNSNGVVQSKPSFKSGGMVVYVSFSKNATIEKVSQAAKTVLNLPIMTKGVWGDGTKTQSLLTLSSELYHQVNKIASTTLQNIETVKKREVKHEYENTAPTLVIIPQANLICKAKNNGKSLQYRDQIKKSKGEEFYHLFVNLATQLAIECYKETIQQTKDTDTTNKSNPHVKTKVSSSLSNNNTTTIDKCISPKEMFRQPPHVSHYSKWDNDTGLPTLDKDGNALTKSALKRTRKLYDAQAKRYSKYLQQKEQEEHHDVLHDDKQNEGNQMSCDGNSDEKGTAKGISIGACANKQDYRPSLDPNFLKIVAGSFGKRQALEFTADMGPFCHVIDI